MNPKYPVYIVSKGRSDSRLTAKALEAMKVPYYFVVEEFEFDKYARHADKDRVLILDQKYLDAYETCDDLKAEKSKGPGAARNFAWDHSLKNGHSYHWVMDDNIRFFHRLNQNRKIRVADGTILRCAEDFVQRYENVAISGFNYSCFCITDSHLALREIPPYTLNTRIYSCLLIRNDIPYRWRCRYNEDTDLSLRVLKDGWCTIQFNAFLCNKVWTQSMKGGNTEEFYRREGTHPKSKMLEEMHPDVSKVVWKFNRWHHLVDYSRFQNNKLIRKPDWNYQNKIDEYGMRLVDCRGNNASNTDSKNHIAELERQLEFYKRRVQEVEIENFKLRESLTKVSTSISLRP